MDKDGRYQSAAFAGILPGPCFDFARDWREHRLLGEGRSWILTIVLACAVSLAASPGSCSMMAAMCMERHFLRMGKMGLFNEIEYL